MVADTEGAGGAERHAGRGQPVGESMIAERALVHDAAGRVELRGVIGADPGAVLAADAAFGIDGDRTLLFSGRNTTFVREFWRNGKSFYFGCRHRQPAIPVDG